VPADLVVVVLVALLVGGLISTRFRGSRPRSSGDEGGGRPLGWWLSRALMILVAVVVLGAMSDGCEPRKTKPFTTETTIERVTCGSWKAEDCPPVSVPPTPPPTVPPVTPGTAGIPDEVPA
jgi:hypothetical protein